MVILDNNMLIPKIRIYKTICRIIFSYFGIFNEELIIKEHKNKINYINNKKLMKT